LVEQAFQNLTVKYFSQLPPSSTTSAVSKQLNSLKTRAKKGLFSFESFWEKVSDLHNGHSAFLHLFFV